MKPVFISYSRADNDFVAHLRTDLQRAGINVWIDQTGLKPGTRNWEQALRAALRDAQAMVLVATPNSCRSNYVQGEVEIAEMYRCPVYPVWATGDAWANCIPLALIKMQYIDARGDAYTTAVSQLAEALRQIPEPVETIEPEVIPDFEPRNPYKGLQAFREDDAGDFFGREALVEELVDALRERMNGDRLLAVIGPSGSGKSSVVMAGLLPKLKKGALPGSDAWAYLDRMVPGAHPLESLSTTLANALPEKANTVIRQDLDDPEGRGLHLLGCQVARGTDKPVVLLVDQFEELFTQPIDENERRQFITLLVTAVSESQGPVMVLLTLRADYYDRPMELKYEQLGKLLVDHHVAVMPMSLGDLRNVIEKPAALPDVQVTFEESLVGDLLFEVRERVSGLPLLQFTLDQLFQQRLNHRLTMAAYRALGGLRGALTRHAEATYTGLPSDEHRALARTLFLRLIEPGATEQDTTRRRASLNELELPDAGRTQILHDVADTFVNARLLTTSEFAGKPTIEVSHEALIREWNRLSGWLNEAREDITIQKDVSSDATTWIEQGSRPEDDRLYRGTLLQDALAWAARNSPSKDEQAFLDASQQQERRLAEKERRRQRLLWVAGGTVIAVIIVALAVVVYVRSIENDRLQLEVDAFEARQARVATWAAGDVGLRPFGEDLSDEAIIASATQIAALGSRTPVSKQDAHGVVMVQVPAGCYWRGSVSGNSDERPVHQVCFEVPFWIDSYEVTNAAYQEFIEAGGYDDRTYWTPDGWLWTRAYGVTGPDEMFGYDSPQQPRVGISWYEARAYCTWRDAQLPTEAQWEYAARGPDSRIHPWGNKFESESVVIGGSPAAVGSRPNGISWVGAYDMVGNVAEWVMDWYDADYYDQFEETIAVNPQGPETTTDFRVLRGSSFEGYENSVRTAFRNLSGPAGRVGNVGFRCALFD